MSELTIWDSVGCAGWPTSATSGATKATAFTPWLAKHLDILGDELGTHLAVVATEAPVGEFRLDIQASDEQGRTVIIENQLEPSDHAHLGQLVVYASGVDASSVIWVATRMRADHRSALESLNGSTPPGVGFFGIEIEAVRIGDSPGSVAMSPYAELVGGHGLLWTPVFCGTASNRLSADATAMAPGDMFSQMHVAFACGRGE